MAQIVLEGVTKTLGKTTAAIPRSSPAASGSGWRWRARS